MAKYRCHSVTPLKKEGDSPAAPAAHLTVESWPIDRPIRFEKNARKWSARAISTLASSTKEYGFRQPIVVDAADVIVIGHGIGCDPFDGCF